ncbi:MAG: tetratricopeptide repeat protein [Nitrospirae bacterium]|nr:tetratricopeptide repeat protein [Nitrospirota bacterium]
MKNEAGPQKGSALSLGLSFIVVVLYVLLLIPLARQAVGWYFFNRATESGLLSAGHFDSGNDTYPYLLGKLYLTDIQTPAPDKAIAHYRRSISLNPLQSGAWTELSRAYRMTGRQKEAERALERAVKLSPNDPGLMWDAGTFWITSGMTAEAFTAFRRYLLIEPDYQTMVYDLSWKLRPDNAYIFRNLVPETYEHRSKYLAYLMSAKKTVEAQEVWKTLDQGSLRQDDFIAYVNFLISNGLYEQAGEVWKEITGKIGDRERDEAASLVWNSGFEHEILNGGFDWQIRETEGVNVFLDESVHMTGRRSLGVVFDGKHNPDIAFASEVIRVIPGASYQLKGNIKTEALTTTNGVFLQVTGHNCAGLDKRSEVMTGTAFWKEALIDFDAPASCSAVVVMARRERSPKLDNKIEGTAWIDGISLRQQVSVQTSSSKKR